MHHRIPGSLHPFPALAEVSRLLEEAVAADIAFAPAHAALGNVLCRESRFAEAAGSYHRATIVDQEYAEAHLALSEIAGDFEDAARSQHHRAIALGLQRLYSNPRLQTTMRAILVLAAPGHWSVNVPLDFVVDRARNRLHRYYVTGGDIDTANLPDHDLVFNAIGEAKAAQPAIAAAARFIATQSKPSINKPASLLMTSRPALADALAEIPGCLVPITLRLSRSEAASHARLDRPFLIRPVDSHGGRNLERIDSSATLADYLTRVDATDFDLTEFVDFRSADGFYRKYRVVFVDGTPFPYHLAISPRWKVSFIGSPMLEHAWMREEEERFLADPRSVFATWNETGAKIAAAIGLDYFGIDCARSENGGMLIFEADAAMLVHCRDRPDVFPYKYTYVPRIFAALDELMRVRVDHVA